MPRIAESGTPASVTVRFEHLDEASSAALMAELNLIQAEFGLPFNTAFRVWVKRHIQKPKEQECESC